MADDIAKIAAGLSEAPRDFVSGVTNFCSYANFAVLSDAGLILADWGDDLFTPRGLAVRQRLMEQS